jgi:hypothetical protein
LVADALARAVVSGRPHARPAAVDVLATEPGRQQVVDLGARRKNLPRVSTRAVVARDPAVCLACFGVGHV